MRLSGPMHADSGFFSPVIMGLSAGLRLVIRVGPSANAGPASRQATIVDSTKRDITKLSSRHNEGKTGSVVWGGEEGGRIGGGQARRPDLLFGSSLEIMAVDRK